MCGTGERSRYSTSLGPRPVKSQMISLPSSTTHKVVCLGDSAFTACKLSGLPNIPGPECISDWAHGQHNVQVIPDSVDEGRVTALTGGVEAAGLHPFAHISDNLFKFVW